MGGYTRSKSVVNGAARDVAGELGSSLKPTAISGVFTVFALVTCLLPGLVLAGPGDQSAGGVQPLSSGQMAAVSGGTLVSLPGNPEHSTPGKLSLEVLETVAESLMPWLLMLDSDTSVSGIHFADNAVTQIRQDGALVLPVPSHIEQIRLENLRVPGGSSMGTITFHNLRFHPDSRLAIRVR